MYGVCNYGGVQEGVLLMTVRDRFSLRGVTDRFKREMYEHHTGRDIAAVEVHSEMDKDYIYFNDSDVMEVDYTRDEIRVEHNLSGYASETFNSKSELKEFLQSL